MRAFLQSIVVSFQNFSRWASDKIAPVRAAWAWFTGPVRQFFSPLTNAWGRFTLPVSSRWAAFRERNPTSGFILAVLFALFRWGFYFLLLLILGVWLGFFGRLPSTQELREVETANSTEIYTADSVLIGKYFIENRTAISLENVSPFIINALIATEDRRFLEHSGIDIMSYLRVGYGLVTGQRQRGGGSTLSQQLAKNLYPRKN